MPRSFAAAALAAFLLPACAPLGQTPAPNTVSGQIDALTGTTREDRCTAYRNGLAIYDLFSQSRPLAPGELTARQVLEVLLATNCVPVLPVSAG